MARPDPYTSVHKMQRARLFGLTVAAGVIDTSNAEERSALAAAVEAVVEEIAAHGSHEERFVHPLLHRHTPAVAVELEATHHELDEQMEALVRQASRFSGNAPEDPNGLYRALAAFTSTYLAHIDREETVALPALWAHCTDDEILAVFAAFRSSRSETTNLASVLAQAPTLNPEELARMITGGLGAVAPHDVADLLATLLPPSRLGALRPTGAVPVVG